MTGGYTWQTSRTRSLCITMGNQSIAKLCMPHWKSISQVERDLSLSQ